MGLKFKYFSGQTPLDEEETEGLKILTISTKEELDEFEQNNIEQAVQWTIGKKIKMEKLISEQFVRTIHKRMYEDVWKWAGQFRKTDKSIGVKSYQVQTELRQLLDNANNWIENEVFGPDEIAIRFKHAIVSIHCFPNGNGRHSRLMADLIVEKIFNRDIFTWGQSNSNLSKESDARRKYLVALKKSG